MHFALALLLSSLTAAAARDVAPPRALPEICTPPAEHEDSTWLLLEVNGTSIRVPPGYTLESTVSYTRVATKGYTLVMLTVGHITGVKAEARQIATCQLVLGNRPATVRLFVFPGGALTAVTTWPATGHAQLAEVQIAVKYPDELYAARRIMWTAFFPGITPAGLARQDCREPAAATGSVGAVLDTGLVSMLVMGATPKLPHGSAVFEFTFDSSGALAPVDIPSSTLPDSALRRLAAIVGSNVRPQPHGAPRAGVRVEIDSAGVNYSLLPVAACGRP